MILQISSVRKGRRRGGVGYIIPSQAIYVLAILLRKGNYYGISIMCVV